MNKVINKADKTDAKKVPKPVNKIIDSDLWTDNKDDFDEDFSTIIIFYCKKIR